MFRTTFYFFILFLTSILALGQENLIVNGSFEEYTSCPTGNDLGDGQFQKCVGWWYSNPSGIGSPDYFNRCNNGMVSVPNNFWGYQEPYDGNGYVGILPLSWMISEGLDFSREMIQTKLKKTLKPCSRYRLSFAVNRSNLSNYQLSALHVSLSVDSLYHNNLDEMTVYNNLLIFNMVDAVDTMNWTVLSVDFFAKYNDSYLTLGFLTDFHENDTIVIQSSTLSNTEAAPYYYIDRIQLIELPTSNMCSVDLPNTFTPNNDGVNDLYNLENYSGIFDIYILNRWGNIVFELTEDNASWDGNAKNGEPCSDGVYFYQVKDKETQENIKSGFIHLFR